MASFYEFAVWTLACNSAPTLVCSGAWTRIKALPPLQKAWAPTTTMLRVRKRETRPVMRCTTQVAKSSQGAAEKRDGSGGVSSGNTAGKIPCFSVLCGREHFLCLASSSPASHWSEFTPGGVHSPARLVTSWLLRKPGPRLHDVSFHSSSRHRNVTLPINLGLWDVRTLLVWT